MEDLLPEGSALREAVDRLLKRKIAGEELDMGARIAPISDYLEAGIAHYEQAAPGMAEAGARQDQELDDLFRSALAEVWG